MSLSVNLFDKSVKTRSTGCAFFGKPAESITTPYVNLSIQLNTTCNGKCKFCEYHDNQVRNFDYGKLSEVVAEIQRNVRLFKLNFTGGEPTLDMNHFERVITICDSGFNHKLGEFTVNTNGIHLLDLLPYMDTISYIALSRHHWDDSINNSIFGTDTVAQSNDIKRFFDKFGDKHFKLHARCNLMRGYIDSPDKIATYLEHSMDLGINWFGLVTLIDLNQWCKDNEVVADKLLEDSRFLRNQLWERYEAGKVECRCADYIYVKNAKLAIFYHRIFCNSALSDGQLVYDGHNLRLGFSGEIIY